jgi:hypothetical protein
MRAKVSSNNSRHGPGRYQWKDGRYFM